MIPLMRGDTPLWHTHMNHMCLHTVLRSDLFVELQDMLDFAHNPLCIQFMARYERKGNRVVERLTLKNKTYETVVLRTVRLKKADSQ